MPHAKFHADLLKTVAVHKKKQRTDRHTHTQTGSITYIQYKTINTTEYNTSFISVQVLQVTTWYQKVHPATNKSSSDSFSKVSQLS